MAIFSLFPRGPVGFVSGRRREAWRSSKLDNQFEMRDMGEGGIEVFWKVETAIYGGVRPYYSELNVGASS